MKKIYFWNRINKGGMPFWQPWGCMGCLGRLLGFFLLLALLIILLSLFRKCGSTEGGSENGGRLSPGDSVAWNRPIADGDEVGLPSPDENQLPPFEEIDPVPNPDDGGATRIYPNLLYVIFDSGTDDSTFKKFAQRFSAL